MNAKLVVAVWLSLFAATTGSAAADPMRFPDLSGYTAVNPGEYKTYFTYMTAGLQFTTPAGYRCRMTFVAKQNGDYVQCWGALPGTPNNHVGLVYLEGSDLQGGARFSDVDLSKMDVIPPSPTGPGGTVNPQDYRPLAPHTKLTYAGGHGPEQTCAVDAMMTACELVDHNVSHGFVLSPDGGWVF